MEINLRMMQFSLYLALLICVCQRFAVEAYSLSGKPTSTRSSRLFSSPKNSRDQFVGPLSRNTQSAISICSAMLAATAALTAKPLPALAGRLEDANEKLSSYGLPPIIFVPPGFTPLVSEFGRGNVRQSITNPILVQFCHPSKWIEAVTTVNNNGESGTVSANDYIKGDSAFFFNYALDGGETLSEDANALAKKFVIKSLSQKGDLAEAFKMSPLRKGPKGEVGNQQYYLADISYALNTEAGFLVARKGIVSMTSVGPYIQGK
jgi:hypothetical protein